jgi:hypothetical protein
MPENHVCVRRCAEIYEGVIIRNNKRLTDLYREIVLQKGLEKGELNISGDYPSALSGSSDAASSSSFGRSIVDLGYYCSFSKLQSLFRYCGRKEMHRSSDNSCPSGLMARAEASSIVAVEVFVEQQTIAPMRVLLKLRGLSIDGSTAIRTTQKNT